MDKIIRISDDLRDYIEGLQYELNGLKDILAFLGRDELVKQEHVDYYYNKYIELNAEYSLAKNSLEETYKIKGHWFLDFANAELHISVAGGSE